MKRLWIAFIIAVFTACLCATEMIYTLSLANKTSEYFQQASKAYENGNIQAAQATFQTISHIWEKEKGGMDIFLYHETIDHVATSIAAANKYAETCNEEFLVECEKIKKQLQSLKESELPKFENIL